MTRIQCAALPAGPCSSTTGGPLAPLEHGGRDAGQVHAAFRDRERCEQALASIRSGRSRVMHRLLRRHLVAPILRSSG